MQESAACAFDVAPGITMATVSHRATVRFVTVGTGRRLTVIATPKIVPDQA
jgi:hypothetical protein